MFPINWNIDGEPFTSEWKAVPENLLHAGALAIAGTADEIPMTLDSRINIQMHDYRIASGSITVREVLQWLSSDQGQATFARLEDGHFTHAIRLRATRLGFRP